MQFICTKISRQEQLCEVLLQFPQDAITACIYYTASCCSWNTRPTSALTDKRGLLVSACGGSVVISAGTLASICLTNSCWPNCAAVCIAVRPLYTRRHTTNVIRLRLTVFHGLQWTARKQVKWVSTPRRRHACLHHYSIHTFVHSWRRPLATTHTNVQVM